MTIPNPQPNGKSGGRMRDNQLEKMSLKELTTLQIRINQAIAEKRMEEHQFSRLGGGDSQVAQRCLNQSTVCFRPSSNLVVAAQPNSRLAFSAETSRPAKSPGLSGPKTILT